MHSHSEPSFGQPDVVVSFDAFKVSRHGGSRAASWQVHALAPWAHRKMTTVETAALITANRGEPIYHSRSGETIGATFQRKGDALDFCRDVERDMERWYISIVGNELGDAITRRAKFIIRMERHGNNTDTPGGWE